LAAKRAAAGRTFLVQIQRPGIAPRHFDVVVTPAHDRLKGANVIATTGSMHRIAAPRLEAAAARFAPATAHLPRPLVLVLLGGPNRVYRWTGVVIESLADGLARLCRDDGCGLLVSASRRTGTDALDRLAARLDGLPAL